MFDITSGPGDAGHGSFGSPDNSNGYQNGCGRLHGDDFGLTARPSLLGLARTYLETQARLWPELAGTPAVPTITDAGDTVLIAGLLTPGSSPGILVIVPEPASIALALLGVCGAGLAVRRRRAAR